MGSGRPIGMLKLTIMKRITIKGTPISVNQLYTGRRFLTPKGKSVKETAYWEARAQYRGEPRADEIDVQVDFYFKDKRKHDIDGPLKAILDSLTGILWVDDSQIQSLLVNKYIDYGNPRTEIEVL